MNINKNYKKFNSDSLAAFIVDSLVDHGFVGKENFNKAKEVAKTEIDVKIAMGSLQIKE